MSAGVQHVPLCSFPTDTCSTMALGFLPLSCLTSRKTHGPLFTPNPRTLLAPHGARRRPPSGHRPCPCLPPPGGGRTAGRTTEPPRVSVPHGAQDGSSWTADLAGTANDPADDLPRTTPGWKRRRAWAFRVSGPRSPSGVCPEPQRGHVWPALRLLCAKQTPSSRLPVPP